MLAQAVDTAKAAVDRLVGDEDGVAGDGTG
jgi:hypothetical protein